MLKQWICLEWKTNVCRWNKIVLIDKYVKGSSIVGIWYNWNVMFASCMISL